MTKQHFTDAGLRPRLGLHQLQQRELLSRRQVLRDLRRPWSMNKPLDANENFIDPGAFDFGTPSDIVVVRAYYQWPTNKIFGSLSLKNLSNGKRLIGSFAAFRNEPFTASSIEPMRQLTRHDEAAAQLSRGASPALVAPRRRHGGGGVLADPSDPGAAVDRRRGGDAGAQHRPPPEQPRLRRSATSWRGARPSPTPTSSTIFDIAPGALFPYSSTGFRCASRRSTSTARRTARSRGAGRRAPPPTPTNHAMNTLVPATLRVADTQIIMAEVYYTYTPAVGYVITGTSTSTTACSSCRGSSTHVQLCDNTGIDLRL